MRSLNHSSTVVLCWLLCILVLSCSDLATGPSKASRSDIVPLEVGNSWFFKKSWYDTLGNVVQTRTDSLSFVRDTLIQGTRWICENYLGHVRAYHNTDNGLVVRLVSPHTDGKTSLMYKYPASVGDTYGMALVYFAGDSAWIVDTEVTFTVMRIDAEITVLAGTFTCYELRATRDSTETYSDEYLSPGYGWIKEDSYSIPRPGGKKFLANSTEATRILLK